MCHRRVKLPLLKWSKILPRTFLKILNTLRRKLVMTYFLNLFKLVLNLLLHGWMKELNSLNFANLRWKNFQFFFHNLFLLIFFLLVFLDICSQKRDSGICPGNVPRFYFEKSLGMCQLFSYGGCGGNSNNFEILDQCVAHCGGPKEDVFQISTLTGI